MPGSSKRYVQRPGLRRSRHIASTMRGHLSRHAGPPSRAAPGRDVAPHEFNCLHVSRRELGSSVLLRAAARRLPTAEATLVVSEGGPDADADADPSADEGPDAPRPSARAEGRGPPLLRSVFPRLLRLDDFFPHWDLVEVHASEGGRTLAYDMVQQLVCSAARTVEGDPTSSFVIAVCRWRRSNVLEQSGGGGERPAGSGGGEGQGRSVADACAVIEAAARLSREALYPDR